MQDARGQLVLVLAPNSATMLTNSCCITLQQIYTGDQLDCRVVMKEHCIVLLDIAHTLVVYLTWPHHTTVKIYFC